MNTTLPVTVVTGFLGAGKTTLVNRWLADARRGDVAVIVNEQGAVGIDGELLAARARVLVEIAGGCVCCTTQAELVRALDQLASSESPPARILIETSGAASPAGVLRAIARGGPEGTFALDGVITVVDASRVELLQEHELALEQIGYADLVLLSRADVSTAEAMARARSWVEAQNGTAVVVETAGGRADPCGLDGSLHRVLALRRLDLPEPGRRPRTTTAHVYESVSLSADGELDGERFAAFMEDELARFAGRIFRTKGILAVAGLAQRMIVQGVADSVEIELGEPWAETPRRSRLVVVGFGLDRDELECGFARCAAAPDEAT